MSLYTPESLRAPLPRHAQAHQNPHSPSASTSRHTPISKGDSDVFGDIPTPPQMISMLRSSPGPLGRSGGGMAGASGGGGGGSPGWGGGAKGKRGAGTGYGDRFIPIRDGSDMHAAYQIASGSGDGKPKGRRRSAIGQSTDVETRKDEVNATFTQLLKEELFSSAQPRTPSSMSSTARNSPSAPGANRHNLRRPMTFDTSNIPSHSSHYPNSSAGTTPIHHHPPPAISGMVDRDRGGGGGGGGGGGRGERESARERERERDERELSPASTLPPLPLHAPATPTSGHARAPGAGPSGTHHRAHQSQLALTSSLRSGTTPPNSSERRSSAMSPPSNNNTAGVGLGSPSTPSKKRLLKFASPAGNRMTQFTSEMGLDSMEHEKYSLSPVGKRSQEVLLSPRKSVRQISRTPFKVLDAPELADDFYLNLVSWSASNVLGVGLNTCVYLWSAASSKVTKLCEMPVSLVGGEEVSDVVTGLEWTNRGSTLAIGTQRGTVEIWDAEYCKKIRTMTGHTARVGSLAWNNHILSSGSRDRTILHRDVRVPDQYIRRLAGHHKQEVCGLRWNPDTDQLASGGNDNKLFVWGGTDSRPTWRFGEHRAAVKAIAWNPHQRGVLASGGGTADKKIRFWNSLTGGLVSEWDTGSQVCNLMWSLNSNELVSTHGYSGGPISNQIHIWRYPSMTQVATLTGHTFRVLYLAMSPDGQTIVTGAGDETLRFWNAFGKGGGKAIGGIGASGAIAGVGGEGGRVGMGSGQGGIR